MIFVKDGESAGRYAFRGEIDVPSVGGRRGCKEDGLFKCPFLKMRRERVVKVWHPACVVVMEEVNGDHVQSYP